MGPFMRIHGSIYVYSWVHLFLPLQRTEEWCRAARRSAIWGTAVPEPVTRATRLVNAPTTAKPAEEVAATDQLQKII